MPSYVAYYRVSTDKQGLSGLGIDAQKEVVSRFIAGSDLVAEFIEVESGRKSNRPQLLAALDACRKSKAVLVIARLDRLARNVAFIANLMESKIDFVAVDMPTATRLTLHIMAAVAEHEREMISQRTKAALKQAKARGVRLGNPQGAKAAALARLAIDCPNFSAEVLRIIQDRHGEGLGFRAIARELNRLNISTPRGGIWYAQTVKGALKNIPSIQKNIVTQS